MKPKVILISHGHYARETYESAKMVVGEIEGLHTVSMLANDGLVGTKKKLDMVLDSIDKQESVLIIADILGGTPCNVAVEAMYEGENVRALTGLNLPMIVEYAVSAIVDVDEMTQYLKEAVVSSIRIVEKNQAGTEEGGYED